MLSTTDYDVVSSNEVDGTIFQQVISPKAASSGHYYCKGKYVILKPSVHMNCIDFQLTFARHYLLKGSDDKFYFSFIVKHSHGISSDVDDTILVLTKAFLL